MGLQGAPRLEVGSVHGRFQPLHNAHLEYILAAKGLCSYLWIGITKYDTASEHLNPLGRHRERPEANPLTYFERIQLINAVLIDSGIRPTEFGFIPFPIETPSALPLFLPTTVTCYTTICEEWNREKIRVLEAQGYPVVVLWERTPKVISGSDIREAIARGENGWHSLVPTGTVRAVSELGLRDRLKNLLAGS
jgi:nicotinamide mononucleotide adenylyltransferase